MWVALATAGVGLAAAAVTFSSNVIQMLTARRRAREEQLRAIESSREAESALRRDSLPSRSPGFINRDKELGDAMSQIFLRRELVLAIEGARGIGKSAAATELAHRLIQESPPGAVDLREHAFVWVDGRNGCMTLADIGRELRVETDDQSVSAGAESVKLDHLRTHLATRKTALVLDNLRLSNDPDSQNLRELLRTVPDGSLVIAALNRPDHLDAYRVPLPEFSLDDVRRLIDTNVQRLKLEPREEFDEAFARRLFEVVGGHPGTITWFLRAYKHSGETLDERLDALKRGKDLEGLFSPIWSSLSDDGKALLAACDCLGGRATAAQLAVACDMPVEQVRVHARELLDDGLFGVVRSAGRSAYSCPQAFALFACAEAPVELRYAFRQRLARHYIALFEAAPEDARAALSEVDIIRAVFEGLARQPLDDYIQPDLEADLQRLFKVTLDILLTLGLFDDRIAASTHAYDSAIRTGNYRCASLAAHILSGTHAFRGDFDAAATALAHGWTAAEQSQDTREIARQMYSEGFLRYRSRDPEGALDAIAGADERVMAVDDRESLVNILDMQAAAFLYLERLDECEAAAQRCLDTCVAIRWERAKAFPLRFLAEVAIHRGQSQEAGELLERAQRIASGHGDQRQTARVSLTTARLYLFDGELDAAESAAVHAVTETHRLGLPPEEEESQALLDAIRLARRSPALREDLAARRPTRLTEAPVAGD